jgi:Glycine rich protein
VRAFEFGRRVLCISVAAALLSACGGGSSIPISTDSVAKGAGAPKGSKTFNYTGKEQTFKVPAGVTQLTVVAHGGEGAGFYAYPSSDPPGWPGRVHAIIPVHSGEKLYVFVGGSGAHGGFNGGGAGGSSGSGKYPGNPGGGASDVRAGGDTLTDRIIVAAGGGGAGEATYDYGFGFGGDGGGLTGQSGGGGGSYGDFAGGGGGGATQSEGGSGGAGGRNASTSGSYLNGQPGGSGTFGLGGSGGSGSQYCKTGGGGGGGGGYYGAGGGGGGAYTYYGRYSCYPLAQGGGGGGGSSYVEPSAIKSHMWTGWKAKGDGLVVFSWN